MKLIINRAKKLFWKIKRVVKLFIYPISISYKFFKWIIKQIKKILKYLYNSALGRFIRAIFKLLFTPFIKINKALSKKEKLRKEKLYENGNIVANEFLTAIGGYDNLLKIKRTKNTIRIYLELGYLVDIKSLEKFGFTFINLDDNQLFLIYGYYTSLIYKFIKIAINKIKLSERPKNIAKLTRIEKKEQKRLEKERKKQEKLEEKTRKKQEKLEEKARKKQEKIDKKLAKIESKKLKKEEKERKKQEKRERKIEKRKQKAIIKQEKKIKSIQKKKQKEIFKKEKKKYKQDKLKEKKIQKIAKKRQRMQQKAALAKAKKARKISKAKKRR